MSAQARGLASTELLHNWMCPGILIDAAFSNGGADEGRVLSAIREIACDDFFAAVETPSVGPRKNRAEARSLLSASGLVVDYDLGATLYPAGADLSSLDRARRDHALELVREGIDEAYDLGAVRVSLISGPDPGEATRGKAMDALVDSIEKAYAYARGAGDLELSLKMADREFDKRFLVGPTADGVQVARRVRDRYPKFGLILSLAHLPMLHEETRDSVRIALPCLARVHIGNCVVRDRAHPLYGDSHPRFGIAGGAIGVPELAKFLRELVDARYLSDEGDQVVAFEVRPTAGEDARAVIAHSKRVLRQAWKVARMKSGQVEVDLGRA